MTLTSAAQRYASGDWNDASTTATLHSRQRIVVPPMLGLRLPFVDLKIVYKTLVDSSVLGTDNILCAISIPSSVRMRHAVIIPGLPALPLSQIF